MSLITATNLSKAFGPDEIFNDVALEVPRAARIVRVKPETRAVEPAVTELTAVSRAAPNAAVSVRELPLTSGVPPGVPEIEPRAARETSPPPASTVVKARLLAALRRTTPPADCTRVTFMLPVPCASWIGPPGFRASLSPVCPAPRRRRVRRGSRQPASPRSSRSGA